MLFTSCQVADSWVIFLIVNAASSFSRIKAFELAADSVLVIEINLIEIVPSHTLLEAALSIERLVQAEQLLRAIKNGVVDVSLYLITLALGILLSEKLFRDCGPWHSILTFAASFICDE